jgi:hypothetical protein
MKLLMRNWFVDCRSLFFAALIYQAEANVLKYREEKSKRGERQVGNENEDLYSVSDVSCSDCV